MNLLWQASSEAWHLLLQSAPYVLFGLVAAGLLKVFLPPGAVASHLGGGSLASVAKAALWGIPLPLCSCGVLPAAVALKKQGASSGATTAFLISTPESGVDSMAVTYALMDPIMTLARPLSAMATAVAAGAAENLASGSARQSAPMPDLTCPVDGCCDGRDCDPQTHRHHHGWRAKLAAGLGFVAGELWEDMAPWFLLGLILAGLIGALVPPQALTSYLGGGLESMLIMLAVGIPLYICATASTPIAAALIMKGVSPGAALVFLLAGPATNITSLTVLSGTLGRRATAIYLAAIAVGATASGLLLDQVYAWLGVTPQAVVGQAAELMPAWVEWGAGLLLLALSGPPLWRRLVRLLGVGSPAPACGCGSHGDSRATPAGPEPGRLPSSKLEVLPAGGSCSCGGHCHAQPQEPSSLGPVIKL